MKGSNFCLHDARQMLEADTKHDLQEIALVVVSVLTLLAQKPRRQAAQGAAGDAARMP
jgi:hypothetical protein